MTIDKLISLIGLILALSIASERLVEIAKGYIPWLNKQSADHDADGRRRATLQLMAVLAGILSAYLSRAYIPKDISQAMEGWAVLGIGLLASGGSGFWNSILSYVLKLKDLKGLQAKALDGAIKTGKVGSLPAAMAGSGQAPSGTPSGAILMPG